MREGHVSHSSISLWKQCQRKWAWKYVYGLEEKVSVARRMGSAFSGGLDACFTGGLDHNLVDVFIDEYYSELIDQSETQVVVDELQIEKGIVGALLNGYITRYPMPMVREVEYELSVPTTEIRSKGFIDGVLANGEDMVEDKLLNPRYWGAGNVAALSLDEQVSEYFWAQASQGTPKKRLYYRVTCKPLSQRRVKESIPSYLSRIVSDIEARPDHYYRCYTLTRTEPQLVKYEQEKIRKIEEQLKALESQEFDSNSKHCADYGGCAFIEQCKEYVCST